MLCARQVHCAGISCTAHDSVSCTWYDPQKHWIRGLHSQVPFSNYIITQFLEKVKRVLNIFYGSFEIPEITLYTICFMSFCPYIKNVVNSSTDTSDYLSYPFYPFLFIPYYNRFLLFIYLYIKKNEKQRKNKEKRVNGKVKLK